MSSRWISLGAWRQGSADRENLPAFPDAGKPDAGSTGVGPAAEGSGGLRSPPLPYRNWRLGLSPGPTIQLEREFSVSKSKLMKANESKFALIYFHLFLRIGTFQWVTFEKNIKNCLAFYSPLRLSPKIGFGTHIFVCRGSTVVDGYFTWTEININIFCICQHSGIDNPTGVSPVSSERQKVRRPTIGTPFHSALWCFGSE
jgi:hypothetical protein